MQQLQEIHTEAQRELRELNDSHCSVLAHQLIQLGFGYLCCPVATVKDQGSRFKGQGRKLSCRSSTGGLLDGRTVGP